MAAHSKLLNNSVWTFNIGINRPKVSDKHWIYYPEKNIPFYRLGFWNNFSPNMAPPGCSALYGEVGTLHGADIQKSKTTIIKQACKFFDIKPSEIMIQTDMTIEHAYVIYDAWRAKNLSKVHQTLNDHDIYSVGRFGSWKYSSMQEAILDGKAMASVILEGKDRSRTTIVPASKYHPFEKKEVTPNREPQT